MVYIYFSLFYIAHNTSASVGELCHNIINIFVYKH